MVDVDGSSVGSCRAPAKRACDVATASGISPVDGGGGAGGSVVARRAHGAATQDDVEDAAVRLVGSFIALQQNGRAAWERPRASAQSVVAVVRADRWWLVGLFGAASQDDVEDAAVRLVGSFIALQQNGRATWERPRASAWSRPSGFVRRGRRLRRARRGRRADRRGTRPR